MTFDEFKAHLVQNGPGIFSYLGLEVWDAVNLFEALDLDNSRQLDITEFMDGCMQLRGQARTFDMVAVASSSVDVLWRFFLFIVKVVDTALFTETGSHSANLSCRAETSTHSANCAADRRDSSGAALGPVLDMPRYCATQVRSSWCQGRRHLCRGSDAVPLVLLFRKPLRFSSCSSLIRFSMSIVQVQQFSGAVGEETVELPQLQAVEQWTLSLPCPSLCNESCRVVQTSENREGPAVAVRLNVVDVPVLHVVIGFVYFGQVR